MTEHRGWALPESHLLPDAVVAFVDNELSIGAHERAAMHIARCPGCAADVAAQRQARAAVQGAQAPAMSAGFLASLRSIPEHTDVGTTPDNLAVTVDGQLVAVQRPERVAGLRGGLPSAPVSSTPLSATPLGGSAPLGSSPNVLGGGHRLDAARRRAAQGAGVVVSGLVLSALVLVATSSTAGNVADEPGAPPAGDVLRAQFGAHSRATPPATSTTPSRPAPATPAASLTTAAAPIAGPR
ncbi:zf-HC2 domain-containing protein [Qaidamihabitans albus]|uniref:zf-HC2 domain-containing protein n=1 Tax=Qaidamihabitans albus TaxID=2795733 RepID=UPI0018F278C2|nr:zf-HC2 domain-containing protein [Qaidamihabitans albus]